MNKEIQPKSIFLEELNEEIYLKITDYQSNDGLAIICSNQDDCLYCDISVNLAGTTDVILKDMMFLNSNIHGSELEKKLYDLELIHYLFDMPYNYGNYPCVKVDLEKIKEYDPIGFEKRFGKMMDNENEISI